MISYLLTLLISRCLQSSERSRHRPAIIVRRLSPCLPLSAIRYAPPPLSGAVSFVRVCSVFHAAWHGVVRDGWCRRHRRPVFARVLAPLARVRLIFSLPNPLPLTIFLPPFFLSAYAAQVNQNSFHHEALPPRIPPLPRHSCRAHRRRR